MHATMTKALRMEFDDVDDRIVEVPAPSTTGHGAGADAMAVVDQATD